MKLLVKIGVYMLAAFALLMGITYFIAITYKEEILKAVNEEFNERIYGQLSIQNVDYSLLENFPNFSFSLVKPTIKDTSYLAHRQTLFGADNIYLQLSILKLLQNQIHIESISLQNAQIFMYRTKEGYDNWRIFKKDSTVKKSEAQEGNSMDFRLERLGFKNVSVYYVDSSSNKTIQLKFPKLQTIIDNHTDGISFRTKGLVAFGQLTFNPQRGSFLKNTNAELALEVFYNKHANKLNIQNSQVTINEQTFELEGNLLMEKPALLSLTFRSDQAILKQVTPLLTTRIAQKLNRFKINEPIKASARIVTRLTGNYQPEVEVLFATDKANVTYKGMLVTDVQLNGRFYSPPDSSGKWEDKSFVEVKDFFCRYENLPVKANYTITHLKNPDIDIRATMHFSLDEANSFLNRSKMAFNKGMADADFHYRGKLQSVLNEKNEKLPGTLQGKLLLQQAEFSYFPRQFNFTRINGTVQFNQSHATIDTLNFLVNENPVKITGKVNGLVPFALYRQDKLKADMRMLSSVFNFNKFKSPGSLRKMGLMKEKPQTQNNTSFKQTIARKIEAVIENLECHLLFTADKVTYRQFVATAILGEIILQEDAIQLNNMTFKNSDGNFRLTGAINNINEATGELNLQAGIQGADVRKLFHSFENFKQTTLQDKNLMGKLHAEINFSSAFDDSYTLFPHTMQGNFEVALNNGRLIDFEPLSKISKIVFKERDFTDIEFADIRNSFSLQGQDLQISRMEIASSVLTLFVGGVFSFDKETDLSIQLPLSNLKLQEDKEITPEKTGVQNAGASVYLRARAATAEEKVKISFDPFKKGLKDNNMEEVKKPKKRKSDRKNRT